jgi:hypothetical protein
LLGDSHGLSDSGAFLVKFDANGNVMWDRTWKARTNQDFSSGQGVAIAPDGNVYLTGNALINGVGQSTFLVKFTPNGSIIWERTWAERVSNGATGIAIGADGNLPYGRDVIDNEPRRR